MPNEVEFLELFLGIKKGKWLLENVALICLCKRSLIAPDFAVAKE